MNMSSSASAILPFAALDMSVLYLLISCALISRRSPVTVRTPLAALFSYKDLSIGKKKFF